MPPAVRRENFEKNARRSQAITAYKLFPGRDHRARGEKGWEQVADFALDWAFGPAAGSLDQSRQAPVADIRSGSAIHPEHRC